MLEYVFTFFSVLKTLAINLLVFIGVFSSIHTAPSEYVAITSPLSATTTPALIEIQDILPQDKHIDEAGKSAVSASSLQDRISSSDQEPAPKELPVSTPPSTTPPPAIPPPIDTAATGAAVTAIESPLPIPAPAEPAISVSELTARVRNSVVNIFCTNMRGGSFQPITGSGVFIDPRGVVLTNAHVAQYLLLEGDPAYGTIDCVLRTGNPATRKYDMALLYLPPTWVVANAANITQDRSAGTGEHDYALLFVTDALRSGEALPETFPFVKPDAYFDDIPLERAVLLAGYPAGFLDGISIQRNLGLISSIATVQRRLTFDEPPSPDLDIISLGGNIIAQEGASGSAVVDTADGTLVGIVVTSTLASTTQARNLNAVTVPHVNRSIIAHTGKSLLEFLAEDPATLVARFREETFPKLKSLLVTELEK